MGTLQTGEVIKEILGIGESLSGTLVLFELLTTTFRRVRLRPDLDCLLCGAKATIGDLRDVDYGTGLPGCAA